MFLWHFVEEIEHRSSALLIHHHVTPNRWYRIKKAPKVFQHVTPIYSLILDGIEKHVPLEARLVPTASVGPAGLWLSEMGTRFRSCNGAGARDRRCSDTFPVSELRTMIGHLAKSQMPQHDPADEPLPRWVEEWHSAFDAASQRYWAQRQL